VDNADPYHLLGFLQEDEIVQITERPHLAANRDLARATVVAFASVINANPSVGAMKLMRDAQKRLIRWMPLISFDSLERAELDAFVTEVFSESLRALLPTRFDVAHGRAKRSSSKPGRLLNKFKTKAVQAAE
jgi:hypothetical protein